MGKLFQEFSQASSITVSIRMSARSEGVGVRGVVSENEVV
jgi:hypothetical protein